MKIKILFSFLFIFCFTSCKDEPYSPKGLTKVSREEITDWIVNKNFPAETDPVYKNEEGEILPTDSIRKIPNLVSDYAMDFYVNKENEIKEIIVRKATADDKEFKEQLQNAVNNELNQE